MATTQETAPRSLIGGRWTDGRGEMMRVRSMWSGREIAEIATCTADDVAEAVAAAKTAQPTWAGLALVERVEILRDLHRVIIEHAEEIAQMITLETGKTINETREELAEYSGPAYQKAAEEVLRHRGMSLPSTQERSNNKRLVLTHRPVGVVAVISPYN
ncbi:MAG: aldehyde dehydrogenase family protein, partial [Solirubrobacteraceae bacterium]